MGLDIYLMDGDRYVEEIPSDKYPGHVCNKTYLRSSYNQAGINSVLKTLTGKNWYWVFQTTGEDLRVRPDWDEARKRAEQLLQELRSCEPLRVITVAHNMFVGVQRVSEKQAVEIARKEIASNKSGFFESYSNYDGVFFMDKPLEVIAAIPGVDPVNSPCVHLVYRMDKRTFEHYIAAMEITIELIDYAKTLKDPMLHWSA